MMISALRQALLASTRVCWNPVYSAFRLAPLLCCFRVPGHINSSGRFPAARHLSVTDARKPTYSTVFQLSITYLGDHVIMITHTP